MSLDEELRIGELAVLSAGSYIKRKINRGEYTVSTKPDQSKVTNVDMEAQDMIQAELQEAFPDYGFIGEEGKTENYHNKVWVCDPLDSTQSALNGQHTCATTLVLQKNNKTILSIVYNPFRYELYSASINAAANRSGRLLLPNPQERLERAVLNYQVAQHMSPAENRIINLRNQRKIGKTVNRGGSTSYNLAQIAAGTESVYVYIGSPLEAWDTLAGKMLIESSGAAYSEYSGGRVIIAAGNEKILEQAEQLLLH